MKPYYERAYEIHKSGSYSKLDIAKQLVKEFSLNENVDSVRKNIQNFLSRHLALEEECQRIGVPVPNVKHYWYKGKHFSINVSNSLKKSWEDVRDDIIAQMSEYAPSYPKLIRNDDSEDGYLLVVDPADVHIGKLASAFETGDEYNNSIAISRVLEGVSGILNKSKGFNIQQILFIGGNDILHIDTPKRMTTSGTPQDTDGMWYDNFLIAKDLYVKILEMLVKVAPVHFVFNPSNHDYTNGFFLADVIKTWFRNCSDITFDCSIAHRKYYRWYNNLIGTTHGDGAKQADLPLLMAQEDPQSWAISRHRYIYTHHVHHKVAKDYIGVTVESLRSPSGADSWHSRNGYQHSPKAIEGFIHCKKNGQIARITHLF